MAGPYDPLPAGFRDFTEMRNVAINGGIAIETRKKLSSSTYTIKKGHPLVSGAGGTYDRGAATGTNEQTTLTFAGTVTSFTISYTGRSLLTGSSVTKTTNSITYNSDFTALAAAVQRELQLLENVGVDNAVVVRTSGTVLTITWTNFLSGRNVTAPTTTVVGGGTVTVATSVAGVDGYMTDTSFLGFADKFEKGSISNWQRHFPQPIDLNLDGRYWTDGLEMNIFPLTNQIFRARVEHDVLVDRTALVGNTYSIGWYPSREQCYVATQIATNAVVKVVGVAPDQDGVVGGIVDFILIASAIALM